MKTFETKIENCVEMTLKVTYNKNNDTLSFYNDELLMEEFKVKELLNRKMVRLVAGQVFPVDDKVSKVYNYIIDFMFDEHKEIYDTIKFNDKFIEFLENIVKED